MIKQITNAIKKDRPVLHWFLVVVFAIQILLLFYYNLFHIQDALDNDFAKLARHIMEMGDRRTLLLPHWDYITTAEWDCAGLIALPLYMITGDIFLSFACANILNIVLFAYVVDRLGRAAGLDFTLRMLCQIAIFTAYDFGKLNYTNMLFFAGAQYIYKALLPLYFILILAEEKATKWDYVFYAGFYFLLFVSAVSSGIYPFVVAVFPPTICMIIICLRGEQPLEAVRKRIALASLAWVVSLLGFLLCQTIGIEPRSLELKPLYGVVTEAHYVVLHFLELFRSLDGSGHSPFSADGMAGLVRLAATLSIMIVGLPSIKRTFALGGGVQKTMRSVHLWKAAWLRFSSATPGYCS